jgi:L-ascorbate metabolism protein UlaG (beta-lactamase superfamily)
MDPAEAVQVFEDLNATQAVGMHWGTFILTDEEMTEPLRLLHEALVKINLYGDDF